MLTEAEGAVPGFMLVQSDPPIGEACPRAMGGTPAETDGPGMRSRKARNTMVDDPRRSVAMASLRRWDGVRAICPLGRGPFLEGIPPLLMAIGPASITSREQQLNKEGHIGRAIGRDPCPSLS